ncbi:hypothetical protein Ahy_B10g100401 isoform C [Arachis hypogaea]|uniref:Uncharacterized protein n=1 Tax=Arachis hypogaea TaxID=3818 RepID=A0A444WWL5_ARAHY|nr:hypothetical protein Ahy_B10g100401 isoform C [Arachis hypogaea]
MEHHSAPWFGFEVKWYSSLNVTSDPFVPTQENALLRRAMNESSSFWVVLAVLFSSTLAVTGFRMLTINFHLPVIVRVGSESGNIDKAIIPSD